MNESGESQHVSLSDVALRAGVAVSTVSRALRGLPNVSEKTRAKIFTAVKETGYRPNPYVNALMASVKGKRSLPFQGFLAWVDVSEGRDNWKKHLFQREAFGGAVRAAEHLGFQVERIWAGEAGFKKKRLTDILLARGIHGVLLASGNRLNPSPMAEELPLDAERFAVTGVGIRIREPEYDFSICDQYLVSRQAGLELLRRGVQRPGYVGVRWLEEHTQWRFYAGLYASCAERGVEPVRPLLTEEPAVDEFTSWLTTHKPDAVICSDHGPWAEVLNEANFPERTGHTYVSLSTGPETPLISGIRQHHAEVGAAAVEHLAEQVIHNRVGPSENARGIFLGGEWWEGETLIDSS